MEMPEFLKDLLIFENVVAAYIFGVFLIGATLMFTRKLPALLVLPLMGFSIAAGSGLILWSGAAMSFIQIGDGQRVGALITVGDVFEGVLSKGAVRLAEPIIIAFFGGVLSFVMQKSGVAESLVKNGAELIGDNPLGVCFFSLGLIALLFTSVGGLGAIIMVALVVFPMLATVGVPPVVIGGIMLIGISLGGILNAGNWALYVNVLGLRVVDIQFFAIIIFVLTAGAGTMFVVVELFRANVLRSGSLVAIYLAAVIGFVVVALTIGSQFAPTPVGLTPAEGSDAAITGGTIASGALLFVKIAVGLFFFFIIIRHGLDLLGRVKRWRHQVVKINWYSYLIPVVPLVLIMLYGMPILASFIIGFIYAIYVTARPGMISLTVQSMISGASVVMPAVMLMIGIGILLNSVLGPPGYETATGASWPVQAALSPAFELLIPKSPLLYAIVFSLAAPLALYRGPLNQWGLGFGVATLLLASGFVPPLAIMAMLMAVGQIQGICDPTNTQNVWIANELRVDVQALLWRTLPYIWVIAAVGIFYVSLLYGESPTSWLPWDPTTPVVETTPPAVADPALMDINEQLPAPGQMDSMEVAP